MPDHTHPIDNRSKLDENSWKIFLALLTYITDDLLSRHLPRLKSPKRSNPMNHAWMGWPLLIVFLVSGCGSGDRLGVAVSGNVTLDGAPLKDGMISFIPDATTESPTAGASIEDGKFSIPRQGGPLPGKYRVEISSSKEGSQTKKQVGQMFGRPASEFPAGVQSQTAVRENIIPSRYNATSELTATIPDQASFEVNFNLTGKK
jgi:hypothetical protein